MRRHSMASSIYNGIHWVYPFTRSKSLDATDRYLAIGAPFSLASVRLVVLTHYDGCIIGVLDQHSNHVSGDARCLVAYMNRAYLNE